ncbi:MAG: hypothetical protein Q4D90_04950 [bacterium]|nr:hypothetical protein [bacterium]
MAGNSKEKLRIKYYECNMTKAQHFLAYLVFSLLISVVFYIYYHAIVFSLIGGLLFGILQEKNFAKSVMKKRQSRLRLQFKEFLEIISISISGGRGRSMENAVIDSLRELKMVFNEDSDIVREISLIVSDYQQAGIPIADGFAELAERSEIDDIASFAAIYRTTVGKSSEFGYIITQTRNIIKDKVEIIKEIETSITAAKSETYMMLVLPLIIVVMISSMGSDFLEALFTTAIGRVAATFGVGCTLLSYAIAQSATEIEL